jgi:hypothetical protein
MRALKEWIHKIVQSPNQVMYIVCEACTKMVHVIPSEHSYAIASKTLHPNFS